MEFIAYIKYDYEYNVYLSFNEEVCDYIGMNPTDYFHWDRYGSDQHLMKTTPRKVLALPRYYRVCSNQLVSFGYSYDDSMGSNIIGIVPIDYSLRWTNWESKTEFFHFRENNETLLNRLLDVEIFLEEFIKPIENPEFVLVFEIET